MKRDMDLVRRILFFIEENYKPGQMWIREIVLEDCDVEVIAEHIRLMYDAGLLQDIKDISTLGGGTRYWVGNLSNEGYDLLDGIREDTTWNKTKTEIKEKGLPLIVNTIKTISTAIISAATQGVVKSIMGGI